MLAVFDRTVAKSPEGLWGPEAAEKGGAVAGGGGAAAAAAAAVQHFTATREGAVTVNLGSSGVIAYSSDMQSPLLPRLFAAVDDIFCLFQGHITNIAPLKQQYGLNKTATEVNIVIEAYRTLRDRGPYPADHVVRDFNGKFAFVLFDGSTKNAFIAADADGSVPLFWGTDSEGRLVLSNDEDVMKKSCGKSFAQFPKGCFFTTSGGLQSFEHPLSEVKPVPRVDSKGEVCGATYKVDAGTKKDSSIPRVGSAANWASQF
ncbi:stem-specific protein TSJT1 [Ananas comosus]|uniref:Stem-specific protein TSJT1 n=1 Tax=Ananas comosus TaxID=4615 RepID=A0A199VIR3_ANACO|nr:stem-specific protein TSJT1 [Ananas comosus]OAY76635.1 Stem-specific protein TSJT1 [Ananas comosus]